MRRRIRRKTEQLHRMERANRFWSVTGTCCILTADAEAAARIIDAATPHSTKNRRAATRLAPFSLFNRLPAVTTMVYSPNAASAAVSRSERCRFDISEFARPPPEAACVSSTCRPSRLSAPSVVSK